MPDERMPHETTGTAPPRFRLGRLVATTGAMAAVISAGVSPQSLLARHMRGDWGDLCEEDRAENERALASGDRLLSCYRIKIGEAEEAVWVITEADRSGTTLLLPDEY